MDAAYGLKARWTEQQVARLKSLRGLFISKWGGMEAAVREVGLNGLPQWYDRSVQALQLTWLEIILSDGTVSLISTYQNDDLFGLGVNDELLAYTIQYGARSPSSNPNSIHRYRELPELPVGEISEVDLTLNEYGDIADIRMRIKHHEVILLAAEVSEEWDGSLRIRTMDGCILVQVDGQMPRFGPRLFCIRGTTQTNGESPPLSTGA